MKMFVAARRVLVALFGGVSLVSGGRRALRISLRLFEERVHLGRELVRLSDPEPPMRAGRSRDTLQRTNQFDQQLAIEPTRCQQVTLAAQPNLDCPSLLDTRRRYLDERGFGRTFRMRYDGFVAQMIVVTLEKELPAAFATYAKAGSGKALVRESDPLDYVVRRRGAP
jgi:hypothetical protein